LFTRHHKKKKGTDGDLIMTDIDESETASKAKLFWTKTRDPKYLTQPKDLTKTTSLSNIDKNYEELTQKRGATEGAISSKVRRWEDWKSIQRKDTEDSAIQDLPDSKAKRPLAMVDLRPKEANSNKKDDEIAPDQDAKKKPTNVSPVTLAKSLEPETLKKPDSETLKKPDLETLKKKQNSTSIIKKPNPRPQKIKPPMEEEIPTDDKTNPKSPKQHRVLYSSVSSPSLSFPKGKEETTTTKPEDETKSRGDSPARRRKIREREPGNVDKPAGGDKPAGMGRALSLTPIKSEKLKKPGVKEDGIEVGESRLVKTKSLGARVADRGKDSKEEEKSKERRKRLDEFKQKLKNREANQRNRGDATEEREDDRREEEKRKKLEQAAALWKNKKKGICTKKARRETTRRRRN